MKPVILATGMGYVVSMQDDEGVELVKFEVEDIERLPWGLGATVTVRTRITGARTLGHDFLTHERINLLGSRSRHDLAARLDVLVPHPTGGGALDWERMVEEVALLIMEAEKRPLTVRGLDTVDPVPEEYLMPLLPKRKATILYGAGGTGKSVFALGIGAAVQTGTSFMGWSCQQANVLYLDWETDEGDMAGRLQLVSKGLGLRAIAPIKYINLTGPLDAHQGSVASVVASEPIGLVILDSVGMATAGARDGGDLADNAIKFFRGLRALGCAVLTIDHVSSDDLKRKGGTSKPFGSVFKVNAARNSYELMDVSDPVMGGHRMVLRHRKANLSRRSDDVLIDVDWSVEDRVTFKRNTTMVITMRPLDVRIMDALQTGPGTAKALADLLNEEPGEERVSEFDVRRVVRDLKDHTQVTVDLAGTIRLPVEGVQETEAKGETLGLD